jgi:hypothetical protein
LYEQMFQARERTCSGIFLAHPFDLDFPLVFSSNDHQIHYHHY